MHVGRELQAAQIHDPTTVARLWTLALGSEADATSKPGPNPPSSSIAMTASSKTNAIKLIVGNLMISPVLTNV